MGPLCPRQSGRGQSGSTCANAASMQDTCYVADGEDSDAKQKLSLIRKEVNSISIMSVDLQAATNSTTEQSKIDTETHKSGNARSTTGTRTPKINWEFSSNITRSTQTTSLSEMSKTDSYVCPYSTGMLGTSW